MQKKSREDASPRLVSHRMLKDVLLQGKSLSVARQAAGRLNERDRALAMELVNGVLRWRWRLEYLLSLLMEKPLRKKDQDIQLVLMMAGYELLEMNTPDYAAVDEAVKLSRKIKKNWAGKLINGVLRSLAREKKELLNHVSSEEAQYSHPAWLLEMLKHDWPHDWQHIVNENNRRPPLWLRVNTRQKSVEDYLAALAESSLQVEQHPLVREAIKLAKPVDVTQLPGYEQGWFSVQDVGAQLAAHWLGAKQGDTVLDLCAAPGGKTCHVLELAPGIKKLVAVELDSERMQRVEENLKRLGLNTNSTEIALITADALDAGLWWDQQLFDCVLVDAPCSATGVIRRHSDIKSLRQATDLDTLVDLQQRILGQAVKMLAPGGRLLYVTCSVLKRENEDQVKSLLSAIDDINEVPLNGMWGQVCQYGRQVLPGDEDSDGFYYALIARNK